jgi:riboflavin synthase
MFTGIIETMGIVRRLSDGEGARRLAIESSEVSPGLKIGDSISINGTCLTVTELGNDGFVVEAVPETLRLTNIGDLSAGDHVNLERPMPADGRFDGHIVQGHVDGVGVVESIAPEGDGSRIRVLYPAELRRYLVHKGSITVDGISLTVAALDDDAFEIAIIPHTLEVTVVGKRRPGDRLNLEVDVIAKYVERMMETLS